MEKNMAFDEERDERIARYLRGQMTGDEETVFLADLASDPELREDAIAQARLVKGMRQVDSEIISALKKATPGEVERIIRPRRKLLTWAGRWAAIAASVAVVLFGGYKGVDYRHTVSLGKENVGLFSFESSVIRGEVNDGVERELSGLFENVVEGKQRDVTIKRLEDIWMMCSRDAYCDYTDYAPYVGWYLAMGYLENYQKDEAKRVLQNLAGDMSYPDSLRMAAAGILDELF